MKNETKDWGNTSSMCGDASRSVLSRRYSFHKTLLPQVVKVHMVSRANEDTWTRLMEQYTLYSDSVNRGKSRQKSFTLLKGVCAMINYFWGRNICCEAFLLIKYQYISYLDTEECWITLTIDERWHSLHWLSLQSSPCAKKVTTRTDLHILCTVPFWMPRCLQNDAKAQSSP